MTPQHLESVVKDNNFSSISESSYPLRRARRPIVYSPHWMTLCGHAFVSAPATIAPATSLTGSRPKPRSVLAFFTYDETVDIGH
jgi:hypothetical protein